MTRLRSGEGLPKKDKIKCIGRRSSMNNDALSIPYFEQCSAMKQYAAKKGILSEKMGKETILMDLDANIYFKLNTTAQWVWEQLQKPATLDELVENARQVFDGADDETLRRDFAELLLALDTQHLLATTGE